ncbi:MAG: DUF3606 domain-containing protein [Ferruginibacter sp.]
MQIKIPKNMNIINTNNFGEFIWWTHHLGINPEKLLAIIESSGASVAEVRLRIQEQINTHK